MTGKEVNLETYQIDLLIAAAAMNQVFFIGNLIFALYNNFKYLCRLHIDQPLIVLFYVVTYFISFTRITETTQRIIQPQVASDRYVVLLECNEQPIRASSAKLKPP